MTSTSSSDEDAATTSTNTTSIRTEPIFVLYGSQTGNSEQAAEDFCQGMKEKYTPSYFRNLNLLPITVQPTCIQLDDFLDYQHAAYTKNIVIFVSSYGVGQAPIGSYKFRSFAEELLSLVESEITTTTNKGTGGGGGDNNNNNNNKYATLLKGLRYAICGLGDSNYTTYLVNPTTIDKGLTAAGATRIGDMGKADANAKKQLGNDAQDKVIARWKEELYIPLAKALSSSSSSSTDAVVKDVKEMQADTIPILMKLDKDYTPPKEFRKGMSITAAVGGIPIIYLILGIIIALVAAAYLHLLPVQ